MRPKERLGMSVLPSAQKTVMLQDLEAGRPVELQALGGCHSRACPPLRC